MLRPGAAIGGRYEVIRPIGEGASGRVYLVRDLRDRGARWAMKELLPGGSELSVAEAQELFKREVQFLRALRHPGLPHLVDVLQENGMDYLVMERIEGLTLEQVRENQGGRVPPVDALTWCLQATRVLEYLHTRRPPVIFRDMKPSNVMLSVDGQVRLVDLGIARTYQPTRKGDTHRVGTPGFCPPEQYQGFTSPATDVYAMGATMFHLLTGQDPEMYNFRFPAPSTLVPSAILELDGVILKCLQLDATQRYPSAVELAAALSQVKPRESISGGWKQWLKRLTRLK